VVDCHATSNLAICDEERGKKNVIKTESISFSLKQMLINEISVKKEAVEE